MGDNRWHKLILTRSLEGGGDWKTRIDVGKGKWKGWSSRRI